MTISFDENPYYPIIRSRPAELLGYSNLKSEEKDALLPLITLGAWPRAEGLTESMSHIQSAVDKRPFILDLTRETAYQASEVRTLLNDDGDFSAWRAYALAIENSIPVVQIKDTKIPRVVKQAKAFTDAGRQVAFRITDFANDVSKVTAALAALPSAESAIIFVDAGYIRDAYQATAIACIDVINEIREDFEDSIICLASSSFPASVVAFAEPESGGKRGLLQILERPFHQALGGNDVCIYGDHSSIHAKVYPTTGGRFSCRIDYPLFDSWAFERQTDKKSDGYVDCAQALIATYPEIQEQDTWGARAIQNASIGQIDGMKTPAMWIAARVNMHISRQLSLSLSSDEGDEEDDIF